MNIADINSAVLKNLSKLVDQKDRLLKEVEKIESQLQGLITGKSSKPAGKRRGRPVKKKNVGRPAKKASASTKAASSKNPTAPRKKKRVARGSIQGKVLAALTAAKDEGVKVVDLAKKLGVKGGALHVWFATTGKKHPITKIGKGHYKLAE